MSLSDPNADVKRVWRTLTPTLFLSLMALVAFFALAGCGDGVTQEDLDQLESEMQAEINEQNSALRSDLLGQINDLRNNPPTATTITPMADEPSSPPEFTTSPDPFAVQLQERSDELRAMTYEECQTQDHYVFLGIRDPRRYADGSFFHYDCETHYWGWYFFGPPHHSWSLPRNTFAGVPASYEGFRVYLQGLDIPFQHQHPVYPDAVRLADLKEDAVYCVRNAPVGDESVGSARPIRIIAVYLLVRLDPDTSEVWSAPAFDFMSVESDKAGPSTWFLEEMGVMPYENGLWSTTHLTAGGCGA